MRLPVYTSRLLAWEETTPAPYDHGCRACVRHHDPEHNSSLHGARVVCARPGQRAGKGRRVLVLASRVTPEDSSSGQWGTGGATNWLFHLASELFVGDHLVFDAALRCASGQPKTETKKEVTACRAYTSWVIHASKPDLIVACGSAAVASVTGDVGVDTGGISRGWTRSSNGTVVVVLPDEREAFRNPFYRDLFAADLELVARTPAAAWEVQDDWVWTLVDRTNIAEALDQLRQAAWVSWDTEYAGVAFDGPGYFAVLTHGLAAVGSRTVWVWNNDALRDPELSEALYGLLEDPAVPKVAQNAKVDALAMLAPEPTTGRREVTVRNFLLDPLLLHKLDYPEADSDQATLSYLAGRGVTKGVLEKHEEQVHEWIKYVRDQAKTGKYFPGLLPPAYEAAVRHPGRSWQAFAKAMAPPGLLAEYQATDTATTVTVGELLLRRVDSDPVTREGAKILRPLPEVAARMEATGMLVDRTRMDEFERHLVVEQFRSQRELARIVGRDLDVAKHEQVARYLFVEQRLPVLATAPTGGPSLTADVLEKVAKQTGHPAIPLILQLTTINTYLSRYVHGMREHVRGDSRVHPSFNLAGTRTGRWSSSDPNFQNIAEHAALAKWVKRYLVAPPGYVLLALDYAQLEYVVASIVSGDPVMQQIFKDGKDMHRRTAELIGPTRWKIETAALEAMSDKEIKPYRQQAKSVNFGALFNMAAKTLARDLECSLQEAELLLRAILNDLFPTFTAWRDNVIAEVRQHGVALVYSISEAGDFVPIRRRPLYGIGSDDRRARGNAINASVNTPVQGSASVIQNKAITKVDRWLVESGMWARREARICNAVHDATYLEVREDKVVQVAETVQHLMIDQPTRGVPLRTDAKVGRDLASMVALKDWTG